MPTPATLSTFVSVSLVLALIPGPSTFFVLSQGALHGRARALRAVAGIEVASAVRVVATAVGLSALLASSAVAFSTIRWGGVAYLAYLGLRTFTGATRGGSRTVDQPDVGPSGTTTGAKPFRRGVFVGLSNVKMAIFFLAFFPTFIHAGSGSRTLQILVLGTVFWIIGSAGDLVYALGSAAAGARIRTPRSRKLLNRTEGVSYLALAGWTASNG